MANLQLNIIGEIKSGDDGFKIVLNEKYRSALDGLDGFSHIQVLWWFSKADNPKNRSILIEENPYKNSPEALGVFATRSPNRPNPIALDTVQTTYIDKKNGIIGLTWIEAFDGTPVIDIKPYTPSIDRVENPTVPEWCNHWPKSYEESGDFDWESEMSF